MAPVRVWSVCSCRKQPIAEDVGANLPLTVLPAIGRSGHEPKLPILHKHGEICRLPREADKMYRQTRQDHQVVSDTHEGIRRTSLPSLDCHYDHMLFGFPGRG